MNKIKIYTDKSLKLNNAVLKKVDIEKYQLLDEQVILIDSFVKSKGVIPVGPLIQKTEYNVNDEGQLDIKISLMRQANNFIHNVEPPYTMESKHEQRNGGRR